MSCQHENLSVASRVRSRRPALSPELDPPERCVCPRTNRPCRNCLKAERIAREVRGSGESARLEKPKWSARAAHAGPIDKKEVRVLTRTEGIRFAMSTSRADGGQRKNGTRPRDG